MWLRPLEFKTGNSQAHLKKALKELVQHGAVTQIKSAETSKVIYISADVEPDAKHRGGGFIDEGKLDEGMINVLSGVAVKFIQERSWAEQPRAVPLESTRPTSTPSKHKSKIPGDKTTPLAKEGEQPTVEIEDEETPATDRPLYPRWGTKTIELIPQHPSYFENYPSSHELLPYLNESGVAKEIVLKYSDVEQLLLKLEFDGYLERMRDADGILPRTIKETRWRATRRTWRMNDRSESNQHFGPIEPEESGWLPGNGLSQVPCSRCPVKRKCEPGGVVSPEECVYLGEWLAF
jgi:DNA-directed RNA polymerase III subunit RPC6